MIIDVPNRFRLVWCGFYTLRVGVVRGEFVVIFFGGRGFPFPRYVVCWIVAVCDVDWLIRVHVCWLVVSVLAVCD